MLFLKILGLAFAYFQTGYWLGRASIHVWSRKRRSLLGWTLFPSTSAINRIGLHDKAWNDGPQWHALITSFNLGNPAKAKAYLMAVSCIWPLKLAVMAINGSVVGAAGIIKAMVFGPERIVRALTGKRPRASAPELTSAERAEAEQDLEAALDSKARYRALEAAQKTSPDA